MQRLLKIGNRKADRGLKLYFNQLRWKWRLLLLVVLCSFAGAVLEGASLGLLVPFLEGLTDPSSVPLHSGIRWVDTWILAVDATPEMRLYRISGFILLLIWIRVAFSFCATSASVKLRETIVHRIRCDLIDQLQNVSLNYFSKKHSGEFLHNLTSQIARLRHLVDNAANVLLQASLLVVYMGAIFWLSWELALFAVVFCSILFGVVGGTLKKIRRAGRSIYKTGSEVVSLATDLIHGIRTVVAFGTKPYETRRFREASAKEASVLVTAGRKASLVGPLSQGIASTGLIVLIGAAVRFFVSNGALSPAELLTFFFALFRLLPLVQSLNNSRSQWAISRNALDEIASLLRRDDKPYLRDGTQEINNMKTGFELRDVRFGYEPGQIVLENINLSIELGRTTAIVGASGAGKTTLVDLIARLYDPNEGNILLDGIDLRAYKTSSLRRHIAIVNQNTFLFHDTVRANIAYGLDDVPEDQLYWVAEKANALEFILELEQGFDTVLGDRGERLSGGQRQRISIARALLRNPEILILDEATSALDSVSEKWVQEALERLMEGRTVLVIAHRLATVQNADKIIVLEDGRVREEGSKESLLSRHGKFWEYYSMQYQLG